MANAELGAQRFDRIIKPYFGRNEPINLDAKLIADLRITGMDYLDLVGDLEKAFGTDLSDFLIGPEPQYISTGLLGRLVREPRKPVYRDMSLRELRDFLASSGSEPDRG